MDALSLIESCWKKLDTGGSPKKVLRAFDRFPIEVRHLMASWRCRSEVENGGFSQFFFNSGGVLAPEAVAGFKALKLGSAAKLVQGAMSRLGRTYPRSRRDRAKALDRLEEDAFASLEEMFCSATFDYDHVADEYASALEPVEEVDTVSEDKRFWNECRAFVRAHLPKFRRPFWDGGVQFNNGAKSPNVQLHFRRMGNRRLEVSWMMTFEEKVGGCDHRLHDGRKLTASQDILTKDSRRGAREIARAIDERERQLRERLAARKRFCAELDALFADRMLKRGRLKEAEFARLGREEFRECVQDFWRARRPRASAEYAEYRMFPCRDCHRSDYTKKGKLVPTRIRTLAPLGLLEFVCAACKGRL